MKLMELFSPIGGLNEKEEAIDWLGDLKFFIDNDDSMLEKHIFPALKIHKKNIENPDAYKIYLKPLYACLNAYQIKFNIPKIEKKFPKDDMIKLARYFADQQGSFVTRGDYEN